MRFPESAHPKATDNAHERDTDLAGEPWEPLTDTDEDEPTTNAEPDL